MNEENIIKNLLDVADFVQWLDEESTGIRSLFISAVNYSKFSKRELKMEMFTPCDEYGKPMLSLNDEEDRLRDIYQTGWWKQFMDYTEKYKLAENKVLFKDFTAVSYLNLVGLRHKSWESTHMGLYTTIGNLANSHKNIEFTEAGIKFIKDEILCI